MTVSQPRRRKGRPYNPAAPAHDRRSTDLLRNAIAAPIEIDDPYEAGAKILAMRSLRADPVADMHARGHLTDCEYETARHWERAYENAEIGGVPAMDPGKEAVDGGRMREVLTDRQAKAMETLRKARKALGEEGNYLVIQVLGTKMSLYQVYRQRVGAVDPLEYKYTCRRFHECLSTLSVLFGYATATRA
jgi:hypothetical protein